mgnify:CR=1 FL=1
MCHMTHRRHTFRRVLLSIGLVAGCFGRLAMSAEPVSLHDQIDALILANEIGPTAAQCDDATFLRRVSLDLIGRIPTIDEVRSFLADKSADKRQNVVDQLMAGPEHNRHLAEVFELMLMERRGGTHVKSDEFRDYLANSFADGKSYLQLAAEILAADGTEEKNRAAAAFYLEREVESHLLTRDIGRIFFGVDLQCAQCHNHPLIDDYHQSDYYGLHAFFVRASLFRPDKKKPAVIAEQATGESDFKSVFTDRESMTGPRIPGGSELAEVSLKPGEQYVQEPAKNIRPIPKVSRVQKLAEAIQANPTDAFRRNIANRLWAHMFGRGLVHPVDLHHSGNPPTHPEVLELLARAIADNGYQVKPLLREIALSNVYQRSYQLPPLKASIADAAKRNAAAEERAEKLATQASAADSEADMALEKLDAAIVAEKPARTAETTATKQAEQALKERDAAAEKVAARQAALSKQESKLAVFSEASAQIAAAAAVFGAPMEFGSSQKTLQDKAAAIAGEIEKLKKALKPEQDALQAASQKFDAATAALEQAINTRKPLTETVRTLRAEFYGIRDRGKMFRAQASAARRDSDLLQTLVEYGTTEQKIAAHQTAIQSAQQQLASVKSAIPAVMTALDTRQAAVVEAKKSVAELQQKLRAARETLAKAQEPQTQLAEAIQRIQAVQESLKDEKSLGEALTLLDQSRQRVESQVAAATAAVTVEERAVADGTAAMKVATDQVNEATQQLATLNQQQDKLQKSIADATAAMTESSAALAATTEALIQQSSARGNVAGLVQLTPEQFCRSTLIATGQYARHRAAAESKLNKEQPLSEQDAANPQILAKREATILAETEKAVDGIYTAYAKMYAADAGQPQHDFFATAEQSLYVANGSGVRSWLQPGAGNLTERLLKLEDSGKLADELYLAILSRPPHAEETADVHRYLEAHASDRAAAIQDLSWGLLSSAEFRFNH